MHGKSLANIFAILVGLFLLVEGIWGVNSEMVFGIFATNQLHAIIHIILGMIALYVGFKKRAAGYCIFLGLLLITVGILWHIPGAHEVTEDLFNVNAAVAVLNIALGIAALIAALLSRRKSQNT